MSELLSQWVRSIAAAALLSGVAMAITPKGKVQRILKAICGVLIIISIVNPLTNDSGSYVSMNLAEHRAKANKILGNTESDMMNLSRSIIEQELEEYILDKAAENGEEGLQADISSEWIEDGYWCPVQVTIVGECGSNNRNIITSIIESKLGIPCERQIWENYEGD